ncbi:MAG: hypothetical protein ACI4WT_04010 [Oligosphaeraceae bacterium]
MILSNTNFTVLYVDPSAASAGDGSTPASALKALPAAAADIADATCYILRRTASASETILPQGENTAVTAFALIGMPKATDELYALMPDEARAAWGADEADYARVRAVTSDSPWGGEDSKTLALPNCQTFFMHRIDLHREGQGAYEAAISLPNTAQTASVSVERCRFGLSGCVLEDSSCTDAPAYGTAMYLNIGRPQVVSIRHCVLNTIPDSTSYMEASSWGILAQGGVFATLEDIDLWCATAQYGGSDGMGSSSPALKVGQYSSYSSDYSTPFANVNANRIRVHYLRNGTYGYLPPALYLYSSEFTSMRNLSVSTESRTLGSGTPSVVSPGGILVDSEGAPEFIYGGLTASLPEVWRIGSGCGVFRLCGSGASRLPGCAKEIGDITVTLGTAGGVDTQDHGNYYDSYKDTDSSSWGSCAALQLSIASSDGMYGGGSHEPVIARNISVTHPRGIALHAANCYVRACALQGMLRAYQATCDITSLSTWYPGNAVGAAYGCTIRIGTLTLGKGNITGTDSDPAILGSPQESQCFIYIGSSNGQLMGDTRSTSTSSDNCYAVVCGSEQDEGHYTMRTLNAMCNTWGVARSGGSVPASLKLSNSTAEGTGFLSLGRQPFGGFKVAVASAGVKTFRLFAAAKGLAETAELARRVVVQVTIPRPDGSESMAFSSASGRWSVDDSTWIGESGLTPFLLEMPVEVSAACTADVKIHFRWYSAAGYLYIDPGIAIE